jgi:hypothetical protein
MKKMSLNVEELSIETFETMAKADGAVDFITQFQSCSCLQDCFTATVGRCCPP